MGLIAANSYKQLNNSILKEVFINLEEMGIQYRYNKMEQMLYLENGARLMAFSLENYSQLRGPEFGYIGVDEGAYARHEAWNVLIGRLRCKHSKSLQIKIASTPNGFNWLYDMFAGEGKTEYHRLIRGNALMNPFLPDGYIDSLLASYDPITARQEVYGEFIAATAGRIYDNFDRKVHVKDFNVNEIKRNGIIPAGACDFNVSPITGICFLPTDAGMFVYDEIWDYNSNTFKLAELFKETDESIKAICPDGTGRGRKTCSTKTDHQILKDAGFHVQTKKHNPARKDRFNAVNRLLRNNNLIIHPRCERLITDLESFTDTKEDHADLGHVSDALGYGTWWYHPFKQQNKPLRIREY